MQQGSATQSAAQTDQYKLIVAEGWIILRQQGEMGEEDLAGKDEYMSSAMVAIKKYSSSCLLVARHTQNFEMSDLLCKQGYH